LHFTLNELILNYCMKYKTGFTLIEILVVVTIIALLSIGAVVSFSQFGKQSRDAKRKADIEQVRAALEMYKSNNVSGSYPTSLNSLVTDSYLKSIPVDPKTNLTYLTYEELPAGCNGSSTACTSYTLTGSLETGGAYETDPYGGSTITTAPTTAPTTTRPKPTTANPTEPSVPTATTAPKPTEPNPTEPGVPALPTSSPTPTSAKIDPPVDPFL
jgi:general secretion pathway protein G